MFIFSVILRWFSVGYNNTLYSLLLPCIVIAIPNIGVFTSYIKNNLEIELREEYIKYLFVRQNINLENMNYFRILDKY